MKMPYIPIHERRLHEVIEALEELLLDTPKGVDLNAEARIIIQGIIEKLRKVQDKVMRGKL